MKNLVDKILEDNRYRDIRVRDEHGAIIDNTDWILNQPYTSPREQDEAKKALKKEHPEIVKQYEQLYKGYFAAIAKAKEAEAEMQELLKEYPALGYMTFKKK